MPARWAPGPAASHTSDSRTGRESVLATVVTLSMAALRIPGGAWWVFWIALVAIAVAMFGYRRFQDPAPIVIRDHLVTPVPVASVTADRIVFADGATREVVGIGNLVAACPSIRSGVEMSTDGRIWGLVPIFHWCGNDPLQDHIERIPLDHLCRYFRDEPSPDGVAGAFTRDGRLDKSVLLGFLAWSGIVWDSTSGIRFPGERADRQ